MRIEQKPWIATAAVLAVSLASIGLDGQSSPPPRGGRSTAPAEIIVPEGQGAPVITDGIFSPGEWDDATIVALGPAVRLLVKQFRGVVFIGVRGRDRSTSIGPSDLFVAVPGGRVHQLHVSAQLGEIVLPPTGDAPPFRFGYTPDWYANEQRRDMIAAERLKQAGKSPMEIIQATSFPADGIEFAIRRSKFAGPRWLMRIGISVLDAGTPSWLEHPAGVAERSTDGWQVLRLD